MGLKLDGNYWMIREFDNSGENTKYCYKTTCVFWRY